MANYFGTVETLNYAPPSYKSMFSGSVPAATYVPIPSGSGYYGTIESVPVPVATGVPKAVGITVPVAAAPVLVQGQTTKYYRSGDSGEITQVTYDVNGKLLTSKVVSAVPSGYEVTQLASSQTIPVQTAGSLYTLEQPVAPVAQAFAKQTSVVVQPSEVTRTTKLYFAGYGPTGTGVTVAEYDAQGKFLQSELLTSAPPGVDVIQISVIKSIPSQISVTPEVTQSPVAAVTVSSSQSKEQVALSSVVAQKSASTLAQPASPVISSLGEVEQQSAPMVSTLNPRAFGVIETVPVVSKSSEAGLEATLQPPATVQPVISAAPRGSLVSTIDASTVKSAARDTVPASQLETSEATPVIKLTSGSTVSSDVEAAQEQKLSILSASPTTPLSEFTTDDFKKARFTEWLDDNSSLGLSETQKDLIEKYAWDSIPFISQRQISGAAVASLYEKLEQLQEGVENPEAYNDPVTKFFLGAEYRLPGFSSASVDEQKEALRILTKVAVENDLPVGFLAQAQQILLSELPTGSDKQAIVRYIESGELENDLKQDTAWYVPNQAKMYAMTREGQMTIGAGFTAMTVVGGALTGGVATAVVGLGMAQFQATELANLFGGDIWRTKEDLKMSGDLAYERLNEYDEEKNSVVKLLSSYDVNKDKFIDPVTGLPNEEERKKALGEVIAAYNQLKVDLGDNAVYLSSIKGYDTAVKELNWLAKQIDSLSTFVPKSTLPTPITIIPPEGGKVTSTEFSAGVDAPIDLERNGTGTLSYKVYDSKGNLVGSESVSYFPGIGPIIKDHSSDVAFKSMQEETTKKAKVSDVPVTIYLKAGQTATNQYGTWQAGAVDKVVGFNAPEGVIVQTKFTEPGKKADVLTVYPDPTIPNTVSAELEDAFVTSTKVQRGIVNLDLKPTQTLYIDGKMQDPQHNDVGVYLTPGTHSFVVKEGGYDDVVQTVYVGAEETQVFSVQGKESYQGDSSGGGGGGGGVSYGGGSGTMIVFGTSLAGARIWLDDVEVQPEIGKAYSTSPGYHAVKATKVGFQDWSKTVYVMSNETLNVDAAFVPGTSQTGTGTGTGTGSGTGTSTPNMSHVTFGATTADASVYIDDVLTSVIPGQVYDLPYGYHGILIKKAGKVDWLKNVYLAVGDTLTISPIFEDVAVVTTPTVTTETSTTKRVYINSNPSGAKILIGVIASGKRYSDIENRTDEYNNITLGFSGEWTPGYLSLEKGLYKLELTSSGYAPQYSYVWVGDTIAFGNTAKQLALAAGWLV